MKISLNNQDFINEANHYSSHGWVQSTNFLNEDAANWFYECLIQQDDWNLVCNLDGRHVDMNYKEVMGWNNDRRKPLEDKIFAQASSNFQYYYATIPIYDLFQNNQLPDNYLARLYELVSSEQFLNACRTITNNANIKFADIQATKYSAGNFLTAHDDNVEGKGRIAAYVLNLSKHWKADWGGGLVLHETLSNPNTSQILFPNFNALNIFSVPQQHSVSQVTQFASADRYSITGWLRE